MPMIIWNDTLSVHISEIDQQHKKLIDILNNLYDAMRANQANVALNVIIQELEQYAKHHFTDEEALMADINYPEFEIHKMEHQEFFDEVTKLYTEDMHNTHALSMQILNFLSDWLIRHINESDHKIGQFILENNITLSPATSKDC